MPLFVVALLVAGSLVGCSSSDLISASGPSTTAPRVYERTAEGLVASITDHLAVPRPDLNSWAPPHGEAECAADRIVSDIGVDRLLGIGFDPDRGDLNLPYEPAEADKVVDALDQCINFERAIVELVGSNGKVSATTAGCIGARIRADGLTSAVARAFISGSQLDMGADDNRLGSSVVRAMGACVDPEKELVPLVPLTPLPSTPIATTGGGG